MHSYDFKLGKVNRSLCSPFQFGLAESKLGHDPEGFEGLQLQRALFVWFV
jgi:hypothetical protein